jgi:hypothetical protein
VVRLAAPDVPETAVGLVVDLVPAAAVERLPEPENCALAGETVPLARLFPLEASAPAKVRLAVRRLKGDIIAVP